MRVRWLRQAVTNLTSEAEYIARDNPDAAVRTVAKIIRSAEALKRFPSMGRPGRVAGTRELVITGTPYVVPYRIRDNGIELLRVFHASRKWPDRF